MALEPDQLAPRLARKQAWSNGSEVEWIQTHISHVFLVGERVYKLRKGVRLPFLDFETLEARNADCLREIALNRRLAPSVYLGIAPVLGEGNDVRIGPVCDVIDDTRREHVVVMRRLPTGRDALSLLGRDRLGPDEMDAVADRLHRFHQEHRLEQPAPWSPAAWQARVADPILASIGSLELSAILTRPRLRRLEQAIRERLVGHAPRLERRREEGRAVDGHGDVHLAHVWFEEGSREPLLIDCLEFSDDLRRIDVASEIAFLAMDLRYRKRIDLAEFFLSAYAGRSDDFGIFGVVDLYAAYRALVRAKVAALAAGQDIIHREQREGSRASAEQHVELAEAFLREPASGGLILTCGTVGSGKSTVARHLAGSGRGVIISSDRVRKHLAGIPPRARRGTTPAGDGIYTDEWTRRVYRGLLERAAQVIAGGRTAILDATFSSRGQRDAVRAWASARGIDAQLMEARCDPAVALQRLATRAQQGTGPSDAGPDLLDKSRESFEPPDEWPSVRHTIIRTDEDGWEADVDLRDPP